LVKDDDDDDDNDDCDYDYNHDYDVSLKSTTKLPCRKNNYIPVIYFYRKPTRCTSFSN
jgi:hypothetical protein